MDSIEKNVKILLASIMKSEAYQEIKTGSGITGKSGSVPYQQFQSTESVGSGTHV